MDEEIKKQMEEMEETKKQLEETHKLVRSDINVEKWNIINTKKHKGPRVIVRYRRLPDGGIQSQRVQINSPISPEDAKVFYLLKSLWEQQGKPESGIVYSSLRKIFNQLLPAAGSQGSGQGKRIVRYGTWQRQWFKKKIFNLLGCNMIFENAYQNKDGSFREYESFTLLSNAKIFKRKSEDLNHPYFDFSNFTIHPVIVRSLLEKNIKPVRADVMLKLKSEIAFILYRWLDIVMADKIEMRRRVVELASELGFGSKRQNNLLAQIRKACKELEGKDLTTGRIIYCRVEKTIDGKNWKLVVKKGKQEVEENQCDEEHFVKHIFFYTGKAKTVSVVGTFNNWQPEEMVGYKDKWSILVELKPGKYLYRFLVDDQWVLDPENPLRERDSQGNENSVLVLEE